MRRKINNRIMKKILAKHNRDMIIKLIEATEYNHLLYGSSGTYMCNVLSIMLNDMNTLENGGVPRYDFETKKHPFFQLFLAQIPTANNWGKEFFEEGAFGFVWFDYNSVRDEEDNVVSENRYRFLSMFEVRIEWLNRWLEKANAELKLM